MVHPNCRKLVKEYDDNEEEGHEILKTTPNNGTVDNEDISNLLENTPNQKKSQTFRGVKYGTDNDFPFGKKLYFLI